jgi:hypothetical protein
MFVLADPLRGVSYPLNVIQEKLAEMIKRLNAGEEIETIGQAELITGLQDAVKNREVRVPLTLVYDGLFFSIFSDGRCGFLDENPEFGKQLNLDI